MASDGQNRLQGEYATLRVANMMEAFPVMVSTAQGQVATSNQILERIGRIEPEAEYLKFTKFMKTNPSAFQGNFNLDEAKGWIEALERTFSVLACAGLQKVAFTTYLLEANARRMIENS